MDHDERVADCFPELDEIESDGLRAGVTEAWTTAMADSDVTDLGDVPWFPPTQRELGIGDEFLVDHVRDVTRGALALAESLAATRGTAVDADLLVAGGLVHDVSKLYEYDGMADTPVETYLGHPHYGVHVVAAAGLPVELSHVVLAHTDRTTVEPAFLEAELVKRADEAAAAAIRAEAVGDLRDA